MLVTASVVAVAGCGEQTMSAGEFVDKVKEQGVQIRLGDELFTQDSGKKLYGFALKPLADPSLSTDEDAAHPSGTLAVYDEAEAAGQGFEQCQGSGLVCYRADNIVVILEQNGIEAQQLAVAIRRLGD